MHQRDDNLSEIFQAEIQAIIEHHTLLANLERECARLIKVRSLRKHFDDEDGDDASP